MTCTPERPPVRFPDDGGQALQLRWARRTLGGRNWLRLYWLPILGLLNLVCISIALLVEGQKSQGSHYVGPSTSLIIWMVATFFVHFAIRFQLASLPILVAMPDFDDLRWDSIRVTPVRRIEIYLALFRQALLYGALPTAILMVVGIVAARLSDPYSQEMLYRLDLSTSVSMFTGAVLFGLSLSALSLAAGLIWRKWVGAVLGPLLPVMLLILIGGGMLVGELTYSYVFDSSTDLIAFVSMLVVPDYFYGSMQRTGEIMLPMGESIDVSEFTFVLFAYASVLWWVVWRVLWRRRG